MERFISELRGYMPGSYPPEHPVITQLMNYISVNNGWETGWKNFLFLSAGAMLNFRSGGIGRLTYLINNLNGVYRCYLTGKFSEGDFTGNDIRSPFCNLLKSIYTFYNNDLERKPLRYLWSSKSFNSRLLAYEIILKFQEPRFTDTSGERRIFHSKSFWIPRELKRRGIWDDFPPEFCCVPDQIVRAKFFKIISEIPHEEIRKNIILKTYFQLDVFRNALRLKGKPLDIFKHYALREITQKSLESLAPKEWGNGLFFWSRLLYEFVGKDKDGLPNGYYDEPLFFWKFSKKPYMVH